jgi:hypothetical protein
MYRAEQGNGVAMGQQSQVLARRNRLSRNRGWAISIRATARSWSDLPCRLTEPNSVATCCTPRPLAMTPRPLGMVGTMRDSPPSGAGGIDARDETCRARPGWPRAEVHRAADARIDLCSCIWPNRPAAQVPLHGLVDGGHRVVLAHDVRVVGVGDRCSSTMGLGGPSRTAPGCRGSRRR